MSMHSAIPDINAYYLLYQDGTIRTSIGDRLYLLEYYSYEV